VALPDRALSGIQASMAGRDGPLFESGLVGRNGKLGTQVQSFIHNSTNAGVHMDPLLSKDSGRR
jgi:hypothetical protein